MKRVFFYPICAKRSGGIMLAVLGLVLLVSCVPPQELQSRATEASSLHVAATPTAGNLTEEPRVGFLAPDFSLPTTDGRELRLNDFRGRPVFINFWATWCIPCRQEMPIIQQVFEERSKEGLAVLAVDMGETTGQVSFFARKYGLSFPLLLDENEEVSYTYEIFAIPSSFFVDSDGVIRAIKIGAFSSKRELEDQLRTIMPE